MRAHRVRALLMGGQACVFYGAAEFSRDTDFAIVADAANLARLRRALADLHAEVIAVPPFELKYLRRGHAIHFRCRHPEALRMRVDVMAKMRGVDAFPKLWKRRTTVELAGGTVRPAFAARPCASQENPARQRLADDPPFGGSSLFSEHRQTQPGANPFLASGTSHAGTPPRYLPGVTPQPAGV